MKVSLLTIFCLLVLMAMTVSGQELEKILSTNDRLYYKDYIISKKWDEKTEVSIALVSRKGKILIKHSKWSAYKDTTQFALISLFGKNKTQLVIQQFSGGAHCCLSWWLYDLSPQLHLIFKSDDYDISDAMGNTEFRDLNNDGIPELLATSNRFAYFDGMCFTCSPMPDVVFKYNHQRGKYFPASPEFQTYLLKDTNQQKVELLQSQFPTDSSVLNVLLPYLYAGREKEGWDFFRRMYSPEFARQERRKIQQQLNGDNFYRYIRTHY